jgi:hypothetical protein
MLSAESGNQEAQLDGERRRRAVLLEDALARDPLERDGRVLEARPVLLGVREVVRELELADQLQVARDAEVPDDGGCDDGRAPYSTSTSPGSATAASVETNGRYADAGIAEQATRTTR